MKVLGRGLFLLLGAAVVVCAGVWFVGMVTFTLWPIWGLMALALSDPSAWLRRLRTRLFPWLLLGLAGPLAWLLLGFAGLGEAHRRQITREQDRIDRIMNHNWGPDGDDFMDAFTHALEVDLPQPPRRPEERRPAATELPTYATAPLASADAYITMMVTRAEAAQQHRVQELQIEVDDLRDNVQRTAEELRGYQRTLGEKRAALAEAERILAEAPDPTVEPREEFERLSQLPGVIAVQSVNDGVRLIVRATVAYEGDRYDLGDWRIDLMPETTHIAAKEVRSGLQPQWHYGDYPSYRLRQGLFCFGRRTDEIEQRLQQRQYLEAMALAVECLCSVNEEHEYRIRDAFRRLEPEPEPTTAEEPEEETTHAE